MKRINFSVLILILSFVFCSASSAQERLKMSTTTSTENSGLLKVLLPPFEKQCNCRVEVIAVGTGKAVKIAEAGDVDVVFVHARKLEDKFVADGFGVNRRDVMYNDFVILGPANDPAGVKSAKSSAEAFKKIAEHQATFISRGDESGTHVKEKEIWAAAGIQPAGAWYRSAGQGMGEVIMMATELRGYTLETVAPTMPPSCKTDWHRVREGGRIVHPYGVIAVNPKKFPTVKYDLAMKFIDFVTGPEGQKIIAGYKVEGDPIFFIYK